MVQPSAEDLRLLKDKVFFAAQDNKPQIIQNCLASLQRHVAKDVLHHCCSSQLSQMTPLMIAARNGHLKVVELLVNKYNVDVNQKVSWNDSSHNALFSAVYWGHLNIVKVLVKNGFDISAASDDGVEAVYMASQRNYLEILKFLVEHGAQVEHHSVHNVPTSLMMACRNQNKEMVIYLLSKGADPNKRDDDGRTALHEAAERGAPDIVRLLLQHGARLSKDKSGSSPLMEAAMLSFCNTVKVFLESVDLSELERIEGLELLGATLAETNVDKAFMYVKQAMAERHKNPDNVLLKPHSPLPTLSNVQESQTLEELQARQSDQYLFRLECLAIVSRILGPDDFVTLHSLNDYSGELQSAGHHKKAVAVLMHVLKTAVKISTCDIRTKFAMKRLSAAFVQMLQNGMFAFFSDLEEIMTLTFEEMEKNKDFCRRLTNAAAAKTWLCYILLALKVTQGQEEGRRLRRLVERFIRLTLGSPVLHTAVHFNWYRPVCLRYVDDLPYDLLVSFLLQCGADVHIKDWEKNTALHVVAYLSHNVPDTKLSSRITKSLLDAGALVGVKNNKGQTPLDLAGPALAAELRELYPVSLKSLAATVVVKDKIPYVGEVPEDLAEFIEKH